MNAKPSPQALLQQAAQIQHLERGRLSIIREGPAGPYYNHQYRQQGKKVTRYVPREQVPALEAALQGYREFEQCIEQYVDQMTEKTRAEIAAGAKKKTRLPNSSWRKTRKSSS